MFADRIDRLSPLECCPAIDWLSFERSFSNLLSGWDARQLLTAGQSGCEFPAGMGIELRTFFQDVNQGKWGVFPTSEFVRSDDRGWRKCELCLKLRRFLW